MRTCAKVTSVMNGQVAHLHACRSITTLSSLLLNGYYKKKDDNNLRDENVVCAESGNNQIKQNEDVKKGISFGWLQSSIKENTSKASNYTRNLTRCLMESNCESKPENRHNTDEKECTSTLTEAENMSNSTETVAASIKEIDTHESNKDSTDLPQSQNEDVENIVLTSDKELKQGIDTNTNNAKGKEKLGSKSTDSSSSFCSTLKGDEEMCFIIDGIECEVPELLKLHGEESYFSTICKEKNYIFYNTDASTEKESNKEGTRDEDIQEFDEPCIVSGNDNDENDNDAIDFDTLEVQTLVFKFYINNMQAKWEPQQNVIVTVIFKLAQHLRITPQSLEQAEQKWNKERSMEGDVKVIKSLREREESNVIIHCEFPDKAERIADYCKQLEQVKADIAEGNFSESIESKLEHLSRLVYMATEKIDNSDSLDERIAKEIAFSEACLTTSRIKYKFGIHRELQQILDRDEGLQSYMKEYFARRHKNCTMTGSEFFIMKVTKALNTSSANTFGKETKKHEEEEEIEELWEWCNKYNNDNNNNNNNNSSSNESNDPNDAKHIHSKASSERIYEKMAKVLETPVIPFTFTIKCCLKYNS